MARLPVLGASEVIFAFEIQTFPFAIWSSTRHLHNYVEAIVQTVAGDGDCDTTCAMVGGVVSL